MTTTSPPRPRRSGAGRDTKAAIGFLAPLTIGSLVFVVTPMVMALVLGMFKVKVTGDIEFNGTKNFIRLAGDPLFWNSLKVTFLYGLVFAPALYVGSLVVALLLQAGKVGIGFSRTLILAPNAVSLVASALVWRYLLSDSGPANRLATALGLPSPSWLGDPSVTLGVVVFISVWAFVGYYTIVMTGGLEDVPTELYEAATLDGANAWQRLWRITLPMIKPTSFFIALMGVIIGLTGMQSFDLVYTLTKGGPVNSTSLTIYYIYQQAFQYADFGYAAAMAAVLVVILAVIAILMFKFTNAGRFDSDA